MASHSVTLPIKPTFATNREGERVADALKGHLGYILETWAKGFEVGIATGYFNPGGFDLIADELEQVDSVRLLLGAEPTSGERRVRQLDRAVPPQRTEQALVRRAVSDHAHDIELDRNLLGFELEADARARRLIHWLESDKVEVRRLEDRFLHGKAFMVTTDDEGVLAGSSNFTYAGLAKNLELNLGHYDPHPVGQVRQWFDDLWDEALPFDLAEVYQARFEPHNPYTVYLRMLYERYGAELEAEVSETGARIHLTRFQHDGLWRAKRILARRHGVLIADGVGLGKSFLAAALMQEAVEQRRQRVLLIAPASLRDGTWRQFLQRYQLGVEVVSYEELSTDPSLNPDGDGRGLQFDPDDYAMVVIDEAHAYRNPDTIRAGVLRRLLAGSPPKDLVLLSATPVNNSLWDLYYLLGYFVKNDAAFADGGIRSLRDHFAEAMALEPDDLSPERLFDVLDAVAVRRTRHFVKRYYEHDTIDIDGLQIRITFPKPVVRKVTYDLDEVLPGFFDFLSHALDCANGDCGHQSDIAARPTLTLARYTPSRYLATAAEAEAYEHQLAGLLRSGLLKRFESSAHAFALTCRRMAEGHQAFLELLDGGSVASGEVLAAWLATDTDEIEDFLENQGAHDSADRYDVDRLRRDVEADRDLLLVFAEEADRVTTDNDPKVAALRDELVEIAARAKEEGRFPEEERDLRKVIVFSYYADTVEWITGYLQKMAEDDDELRDYLDRIVSVSGRDDDATRVMFGFAPRSMEAPPGRSDDRYDALITTDVLAEGVNLQQARHIINYDLPWNPMRLVQRHGRIDRIGSAHDRVYLRCFFPDRRIDDLLGLEQRLHNKIHQAAMSVGVEGEVLPGSRSGEVVFADTRDEIERLRREDASLFETGGESGAAYSGEEYRQELREGLESPSVAEVVKKLPWGSGSGKAVAGAAPGFVFCARIADHSEPVFRYVDCSDPDKPEITVDTLTCLSHAHATPETDRVLSDETHRTAYGAWAAARAHILGSWQQATDPRNLQPKVPKTMRDAASLVRDHPPVGMLQEEVDRIIDSLEAPYAPRVQKVIRDAMRSSDRPREAALAVARAAIDQGLEPSPPPEPLPVITIDDIHLVCWVAIVREQAETQSTPGGALGAG